jgi:purine nucleoside phosphorylase
MPHAIRDFAEMQAQARERAPRIALILGSGLSNIADRLTDAVALPFADIPGLAAEL